MKRSCKPFLGHDQGLTQSTRRFAQRAQSEPIQARFRVLGDKLSVLGVETVPCKELWVPHSAFRISLS